MIDHMAIKENNSLGFKKEAMYKIVVDGLLDDNWSDTFEGMQIIIEQKEVRTVSSLIGVIKDQSALSGILNNLHDLHFTVISVNMLTEKSNQ